MVRSPAKPCAIVEREGVNGIRKLSADCGECPSATVTGMICANVYDEIRREEFLLKWGVYVVHAETACSTRTLLLSVSYFRVET